MNDWKIWDKDSNVEMRSYLRAKKELPEMECTKQLVDILSTFYQEGDHILDVGCAAGHYYNGLQRINKNIKYTGVDSTSYYIDQAKEVYKDNNNTTFHNEDIFSLPESLSNKFDIVYCCNVILHLPSCKVPINNLLKVSKKTCIIRTLISNNTHLSKFLYTDDLDENFEPTNFVHQNTYSKSYIKKVVQNYSDSYKVNFIEDKFNDDNINSEFNNFNDKQSAVTKSLNGVQIAGSKVFEWAWVIITK